MHDKVKHTIIDNSVMLCILMILYTLYPTTVVYIINKKYITENMMNIIIFNTLSSSYSLSFIYEYGKLASIFALDSILFLFFQY